MRTCGDCSLCCKVMFIKELMKPVNRWCQHADAGHGCRIYASRPNSCQLFECMWLQETDMPEDLKPNKSHVVLWVTEDGTVLIASVDPNYPEAYLKGEMGKMLANLARQPGAKIGVVIGDKKFPYFPEMHIEHLYDEIQIDDESFTVACPTEPVIDVPLSNLWRN